MTILAHATQATKAKPEAIFALWEDINNWHEHDNGIEWAKLTDTFAEGGRYIIKPKGGPKVKATIIKVEKPYVFVDISYLLGAKLRFDHAITQKDGTTHVDILMTVSGPFSKVWAKILGANQQADLESATKNLIARAEASA